MNNQIALLQTQVQTLSEKLKTVERAAEIYESMWQDACDWANIDEIGAAWPDEIQELTKLGYEHDN